MFLSSFSALLIWMMELSWFSVSFVLSRFFPNTCYQAIMESRSWNCVNVSFNFLFGYIFRLNYQWKTFWQTWKKIFNYGRNSFTICLLSFVFICKFSHFYDIYEVRLWVQFWIYDCINYKHVCRVFANKVQRKGFIVTKLLRVIGKSIWDHISEDIFVKLHIWKLEINDVF